MYINMLQAVYPAKVFKNKGVPEKADCYLSIQFARSEREELNIEFSSAEQRDLFGTFLKQVCPRLSNMEPSSQSQSQNTRSRADSDDESK